MRGGAELGALSTALAVGARVSVIRGGAVLAESVPVREMVAEWSTGRNVTGLITYKAPRSWAPVEALDPLNNFGQRSVIEIVARNSVGAEFVTPLGAWLHTHWEVKDDYVEVTCRDLFQVLEEDPMVWPSSPGANATLLSELSRLSHHAPIALDKWVSDSRVSSTYQWGHNRIDAMNTLARAHGAGLRAGNDGAIHAYPLMPMSEAHAVYEARDLGALQPGNGLLVSMAPKDRPEGRTPNRWVSVAKASASGMGEVTHFAPPYEPANYGSVTDVYDVTEEELIGGLYANAEARSKVPTAISAYSLEIVPDPRLELGDIVSAFDGERLAYGRVNAISFNVTDVDSPMRVDIEVVNDQT